MNNHYELYAKRTEPTCLKNCLGYINLRECIDVSTLRKLEAELQSVGDNTVVVPWLSRPFGSIEGYGIYLRPAADKLIQQAQSEHWPDPIPGRVYDLDWIIRRINRCSETTATSS
jgi:hypothetical protein